MIFLFVLTAVSLCVGIYVGIHLGAEHAYERGYVDAMLEASDLDGYGDYELKGYPGSSRDDDGNPTA